MPNRAEMKSYAMKLPDCEWFQLLAMEPTVLNY